MKKLSLCVIAARAGSVGVKHKNIRALEGKSLFEHALDKAKKIKNARIFISTDSKQIIRLADKNNIKVPILRPKKLSSSRSGKFEVWKHALDYAEKKFNEQYFRFIDIDCTNPLINIYDIKKMIKIYDQYSNREIDGIFTVYKSKKNPYFNILEKNSRGFLKVSKRSKKNILSRQAAPECYDHVSGAYVLSPKYIKKSKNFLDGNLIGYHIKDYQSIDIDSKFDLSIVKELIKKK